MTSLISPGPEAENNSPFKALGAPGFAIYGGWLVEQEKDSRLTGTEKYRTFANILANTAIVAAGVRLFLNLIAGVGWRVEPADESPKAAEIAETIQDIMEDMTTPWHRVVRRAAMFKFYGFSLQEWTAKRREDGIIGFKDIEPRPQKTIERWDTDATGTVLGVFQTDPQTQRDIYLPRAKLIYVVDDSVDDNPAGLGLFRHLAKPSAALDRYLLLEGWGFERDLRGTPIGRAPLAQIRELVRAGKLTEADAAACLLPLQTFITNAMKGKDTGLLLDSALYRATGEQQTPVANALQYTIELLQGAPTNMAEIAKAIERLNWEMALVLGCEHLLLGSRDVGSLALSKDKTQSFGLIVDSALRELRETFEADFCIPLFNLNGWDWSLFPSLKTDPVQFRDLDQISRVLSDMAKAGAPIMPNDPIVNEVRDLMGFSPAPEMEMELALPTAAPTPTLEGEGKEEETLEPEDEGEEA